MDSLTGLLVFAFHSTVIKTPRVSLPATFVAAFAVLEPVATA
jgi:hypothetical protein